ncbi:hypothetical protein [Kibdelosporangium philippinense]|uniref:hypothetical protein n=1 Tax=Kibdelosporangium philippinense TaxID=211113 RepID=UPI00360BE715
MSDDLDTTPGCSNPMKPRTPGCDRRAWHGPIEFAIRRGAWGPGGRSGSGGGDVGDPVRHRVNAPAVHRGRRSSAMNLRSA